MSPYKTCIHSDHEHVWPTAGELTVERCEKFCYFCGKEFQFGWFVRRHVRSVHCKEYPNLTVKKKWTGSPEGNKKAGTSTPRREKKKQYRERERARAVTPPSPTPAPTQTQAQAVVPLMITPSPESSETCSTFTTFQADNLDPQLLQTVTFTTPQTVRTDSIPIPAVLPILDHHSDAHAFAWGLDSFVRSVQMSEKLCEEEIAFVLQSFTENYKAGRFDVPL